MKFSRKKISGPLIFCLFISLIFICTTPPIARATIIKRMELNELVEKADRIFVGKVTNVDSFWDEKHERIWTAVIFSIIQNIKGKSTDSITVKLLGGVIEEENIEIRVVKMPEFEVGEEGLIFLKDKTDLYCPIVGWFQGRFKIYKDEKTGQDIVKDNEGHVISRFQVKRKLLKKLNEEAEKLLLSDFLEQINTIIRNR